VEKLTKSTTRAKLCQCQSRPFQSSSGLHSGSFQRLAMQNCKTQPNLAEDNLCPLNFGLVMACLAGRCQGKRRAWDWLAWRLLMEAATPSWHGLASGDMERANIYLIYIYKLSTMILNPEVRSPLIFSLDESIMEQFILLKSSPSLI